MSKHNIEPWKKTCQGPMNLKAELARALDA